MYAYLLEVEAYTGGTIGGTSSGSGWILFSGSWDDAGFWIDTSDWLDAGGDAALWSDSGTWADAEFWSDTTTVSGSSTAVWSDSETWSDAEFWSDTVSGGGIATWSDSDLWSDTEFWSDTTSSGSGGTTTLHLATHTITTSPTDSPANTIYSGRITEAGSFSKSLVSQGRLGRASDSWGFITLANSDGGLDLWLDYGFAGRGFVLRELANKGDPVSSAITLFRGTIAALESGNAADTLQLRIRDRLTELQVPVLTARYAGTSSSGGAGAEGEADLKDQLKPRVFGSVVNIQPKVANQYDLIYQVSITATSSIIVYDGGAALMNVGDFGTLAALLAATVAPGEYVTCLALGLFRLGGSPALTVTADVTEDAADLSAAGVVSRILDTIGISSSDRDAATFTALGTFNSAPIGLYVDAETTALDLIGQVLGSIGGAIVSSADGLFQVFGLPATVAGSLPPELTLRDLAEGGTFSFGVGPDQAGVPAWNVTLNYGKVWATMTEGQLAGVVGVARRTYLASQWRQATAQNAAVKIKNPLASQLTLDTLLASQSDAETEANRQLGLYSVRRDLISFPTAIDRAPYELGDRVTLTIPRFGYDSGRAMSVVGRHVDADKRVVTLDLWG
jgi:hypothetical protein